MSVGGGSPCFNAGRCRGIPKVTHSLTGGSPCSNAGRGRGGPADRGRESPCQVCSTCATSCGGGNNIQTLRFCPRTCKRRGRRGSGKRGRPARKATHGVHQRHEQGALDRPVRIGPTRAGGGMGGVILRVGSTSSLRGVRTGECRTVVRFGLGVLVGKGCGPSLWTSSGPPASAVGFRLGRTGWAASPLPPTRHSVSSPAGPKAGPDGDGVS